MSDDQEDIERIKQEKPKIATVLLHQLSSEMLTMKKEIEELQAEVKLNQLRHDDEMGDANANIISLKKQINSIWTFYEQEVKGGGLTEISINDGEEKINSDDYLRQKYVKEEKQNMTDKEAAIKGLNKMLFGKEKE
jgi:hypothetical protein